MAISNYQALVYNKITLHIRHAKTGNQHKYLIIVKLDKRGVLLGLLTYSLLILNGILQQTIIITIQTSQITFFRQQCCTCYYYCCITIPMVKLIDHQEQGSICEHFLFRALQKTQYNKTLKIHHKNDTRPS